MRINRFIALASGLSRRAADAAIQSGRVRINDKPAEAGYLVRPEDVVSLDGKPLTRAEHFTVVLHKPVGYVTSRNGQGSRTIYELLPAELHALKPVGRLDKDSSGLLLLTNDGDLANRLTHPRYRKVKKYEVRLDETLAEDDRTAIERGIRLPDGLSKLTLRPLDDSNLSWEILMNEGRNRQIRRTFASLGYKVVSLQRTEFGGYHLSGLKPAHWQHIVIML